MLTINQVIKNISTGQAAIQTKYIYDSLNQYYDSIKLDIKIEKAETQNDGTIIYFKVPSSKPRLFYDLVLWVSETNKIRLDSSFKLYSNSPNFGYTFAHLYYKNGSLLFPNFYPTKILTMPPKVKNPSGIVNFDKHTYAIIRHVFKENLKKLTTALSNKKESVQTFIEKEREMSTKRK